MICLQYHYIYIYANNYHQLGGHAASTICKWGGGYSHKKDNKHGGTSNIDASNGKKKINIPCKWGTQCNREGCWFLHS